MTDIELVKEKTSKEMRAEGGGFIPVGFNVMDGTIGDGTFSVMISGSKLYFKFEKGKRWVSANLERMISDAYQLAMEE